MCELQCATGHAVSLQRYQKFLEMQIDDRLYHVAGQCCEKDCMPSSAGAYIFGHGSVSGLRHRSANITIIAIPPNCSLMNLECKL